ncbi:MAG: hypothetical protein R2932_44180 [Caldilineaceae bacterium]
MQIRFPWTFPILFSPHDPNILYTAGNQVFRTTNEGLSWEAISPDLTRNDPEKLKASGGPITLDTSGAEHYCTIYTLRESIHEAGVFWAGSDDGLVHLSRDNGETWTNVTPADLPEWTYIRTVEPSPHDPATCYLAATRYKLDDNRPFLYKTTDWGATWTKITNGISDDDFTRVIRTDPTQPGLLYAGTETGIYLSFNDGVNWQRWGSNFPVTPVYDLLVKENDLVAGTHGRAMWVMDDLTPLHRFARELAAKKGETPAHLFQPRTTYRLLPDLFAAYFGIGEGRVYGLGLGKNAIVDGKRGDDGQLAYKVLDAGKSAPQGALINYYLAETPADDVTVTLEILDDADRVIRNYGSKPAGYDKLDDKDKALNPGPWLVTEPGVHRLVWDLRHEGATKVRGNKTAGEAANGPFVLPGTYTARLTVGDFTQSATFDVVNDPRVETTPAELAEQSKVLHTIFDKVSAIHSNVNTLRDVRTQVQSWADRLAKKEKGAAVVEAATKLVKDLDAIEDTLILPGEQEDTFGLAQPARLNAKISSLIPIVGSADRLPTAQAQNLFRRYAQEADDQLTKLHTLLNDDLETLNSLIQDANVPAIVI